MGDSLKALQICRAEISNNIFIYFKDKKFLDENKDLKKSYKNCWFVPVNLHKYEIEDSSERKKSGKNIKGKSRKKKKIKKAEAWIDVLEAR